MSETTTSQLESGPSEVEIGDSVIYQNLQDEVVILNMATQQYYGLDNVGASMWKLLLEKRDVSAAAEGIVAQYAVASEDARRDLAALVRELMGSGLLRPATASGTKPATASDSKLATA